MNDFSHYYCTGPTDMDVFSHHSDPLPLIRRQYSPSTTDQLENSTMSDGRIGNQAISYTEDDIMLASSHPKKPTGRKKFKETRHPVYRGVRRRNSNRWVCEVREPNKKNRIWLGTYPTAEMAARAHDVAALALRGLKSCLNFADSAWRLPVPASTDPEDIQRAAAEAAEMFRPEELDEENLVNKDRMMTISMDETSAGSENQNVTNNMNEAFTAHNMNESNWRAQPQEGGTSYYLDEEAVFDMPGLLNSMAEGLMLPPPSYQYGQFTWDNTETDADMNLWNF
ncbi:hypothetical protein QQ045_001516 [Rhodiola kirilowii]